MFKFISVLLLIAGIAPIISASAKTPPAKPPIAYKTKPKPAPTYQALQNRLKGYWISQDKEHLRWEFEPKKGNTGILYAWFRDISYQKRTYILKGNDMMTLPQLKMNVKVKFDRDTMTLTEKDQVLKFKRVS